VVVVSLLIIYHLLEQCELDHCLFSARSNQCCLFSIIIRRFCSIILSENGEPVSSFDAKTFITSYFAFMKLASNFNHYVQKSIRCKNTAKIMKVYIVALLSETHVHRERKTENKGCLAAPGKNCVL